MANVAKKTVFSCKRAFLQAGIGRFALQKCHFRTPKVPLLHLQSATLARQNGHFGNFLKRMVKIRPNCLRFGFFLLYLHLERGVFFGDGCMDDVRAAACRQMVRRTMDFKKKQ